MFTRSRHALTAGILATALVASLTAPSFADRKDDLEQQKKDANSGAEKAKKDLDESTKELADAAAALKTAQSRLDAATAKLGETRGKLAVAKAADQQMQVKLNESQVALEAARIQLAQGEKKLKASAANVEEFAVQEILRGDGRLRAVSGLLRGGTTSSFGDEVTINNAVSDQQVATMQQLDATRVILKLNRQKVQKLLDQVKVQRAQAAANLVEQQRLKDAAEGQAREVAVLVTKREGAKRVAAATQAEDQQQYQAFRAEAAATEARLRKLIADELAAEERRKKGKGPSKGSGSGGDSGATLSHPVYGPITSPYGMRRHPITGVYKLHDGTDFGVACGTPVHAAASGTIVEQYFNVAYGNRIILNNGIKRGVSVVTTYNHLSRFALGVGSKVSRGQLIGYSGTTGYSTGCHLHFMVLVNGATVNPMGWL